MKDLIIGAGLAGLYQAYKLLRQGNQVTILEKTDEIGGQLRTVKYTKGDNSFFFDIGPHISPASNPIWDELCDNMDCVEIPTPIISKIKLKKGFDLLFPPSISNLNLIDFKGVLNLFRIIPWYLLRSLVKINENNLEDSLMNSWGDLFYYK